MARSFFAGLDVGVETTSLCVTDDTGAILQQSTCRSDPQAIHREIRWLRRRRSAVVSMETGGIAIARGLRTLGYTVTLYENRQLSKFLRLRRNKTDLDDARGIAEASRLGRHTLAAVHLKTLSAQALQSRLVLRRHIIRDRIAAVSLLCRQIELYGGRISKSDASRQLSDSAHREISKLVRRRNGPPVDALLHLLSFCEHLTEQQRHYDKMLIAFAQANAACRLFMEIPGVGPICALYYVAAIDDPHRFRRAHDVGSYFGLAPRLNESGLSVRRPRISKMGNRAVRTLLVSSAMTYMRSKNRDPALYQWALGVEARSGKMRSRIALARKLSVIMLTMWKNEEHYRFHRENVMTQKATTSDLVSETEQDKLVGYFEAEAALTSQ